MYKKNKTKPTNGQNKRHQETTKKESQLTSDTLACWTISKQISQEDEVQQSVASLLPPPTLWDVSPFGNTGKLHVLTVWTATSCLESDLIVGWIRGNIYVYWKNKTKPIFVSVFFFSFYSLFFLHSVRERQKQTLATAAKRRRVKLFLSITPLRCALCMTKRLKSWPSSGLTRETLRRFCTKGNVPQFVELKEELLFWFLFTAGNRNLFFL